MLLENFIKQQGITLGGLILLTAENAT